MKVLHVIPFLSGIYGGPSKAVVEMCRSQNACGIQADIATTVHGREPAAAGGEESENERLRIFCFPALTFKYRYSPPLKKWLVHNIRRYDVVHIHSIFSYPTFAASRACMRQKVPYIVRTQGTLYPWGLSQISPLKKIIYLRLVELDTLRRAAFVHFTTLHEQSGCCFQDLRKKSYVLPIGVEPFSGAPAHENGSAEFEKIRDTRILLFLGRIHRIKGLERFIPAIAPVLRERSGWTFVLAGDGQEEYVRKIRELVRRENLDARVAFCGFVDGARKQWLLRHAWAFVLPSYSENFGLAAAEALHAGLPVAVSDGVAIQDDLKECGAGLVFGPDAADIRRTVEKLMEDIPARAKLADAAKKLAAEKYSWPRITEKQIRIYRGLAEDKVDAENR